uniref:Uncharacterized protein n=1 Tax=Chromera velia CCMP2878 TaxID=1169474 RepID=A0A0G4FMK6_9ALVE|eukprot:Cvel_17761.t1-p1 / transcript=Cvel_17761.t1 / gene=Cvel_17761 / organism=Chromera_velia_CCMP2878 / gene_product=hypothetical protein / transcript_product=hypothetical protein / location=Cvel_scaffold1436:13520-14523(-) / protein_length=240 / sequence_SO=supercontig / SO=protein_coding / is_pseudo=false
MKRAAHLGAPLGLSIPRGAARSHLTETIQESEEEEEGDGTEGRGRKGTGGASSSSQQGACVFSHTWRRGSQQQQGQNSREGAGRAERGRGKGGSGGENAVKSYGFQDLFPSSPSSLLTVDDIGWAAADGAAASSSSSHIPPPRGSRERNSLRLKKEGSGPSLPQRPCGPLRPHSLPFNDGGGAGGSDGNEASVPAPPPSPPRPKAFTRLPPKKAGGSPMQKPSAGGNVKGSNPTLTGLSR